MLDPHFPERLVQSGDQRTIEFIHSLFEQYSKRGLTKKTDRCVAISALEARIARARRRRCARGTCARRQTRSGRTDRRGQLLYFVPRNTALPGPANPAC